MEHNGKNLMSKQYFVKTNHHGLMRDLRSGALIPTQEEFEKMREKTAMLRAVKNLAKKQSEYDEQISHIKNEINRLEEKIDKRIDELINIIIQQRG